MNWITRFFKSLCCIGIELCYLSENITKQRFVQGGAPLYKLEQVHTSPVPLHYHLKIFLVLKHVQNAYLKKKLSQTLLLVITF